MFAVIREQHAGYLLVELTVNALISSIILLSVISLYMMLNKLWLQQVQIAHMQEDIRASYFVIKSQLEHLPLRLKVLNHQLYFFDQRWQPLAQHVNQVNVYTSTDVTKAQFHQQIDVQIEWQLPAHQIKITRWRYAV